MAGRNNYLFPPCGARARSVGRPCIRKPVLGSETITERALPSHVGLSLKPAAPKTAEGIAAIQAGQARRWAAYRADKEAGSPRKVGWKLPPYL